MLGEVQITKMLKEEATSAVKGRMMVLLLVTYSSVLIYCPPYHFSKIFQTLQSCELGVRKE